MTDEAAALALIMLSELPYVGERAVARICQLADQRRLSVGEVLALPPAVLAEDYRLPAAAVARLTTGRSALEAYCRQLLARLLSVSGEAQRPGDPGYPHRWRRCADPAPPVVYLYGNPAVLALPTVAILNSRTVTAATVSTTVRIVQCAAREGFTLVTGGMKSTHRIAAVAVRAAAAPHVVVLDRGLFATFGADLASDPFGFGPGRCAFDSARTLVVSSFRLNDHAAPRNGRRRDELMAALADVVIAVSARAGGEIERTCLRALDHGQCVLSWQGENRGLLAAGASAIDDSGLHAGLSRFLPQE